METKFYFSRIVFLMRFSPEYKRFGTHEKKPRKGVTSTAIPDEHKHIAGEPGAVLPVAGGMPLARDPGTEVLRARQQFRLYKQFHYFTDKFEFVFL